MKASLAALAALCTTVFVSGATITAREVSALTRKPEGVSGKDLIHADHTFTRELRTEVGLTSDELTRGHARVQAYYYSPARLPDYQIAGNAEAIIEKPASTATHFIRFQGPPGLGKATSWAARVIVNGKAVAWVGEDDKALAWVKALPVDPAP